MKKMTLSIVLFFFSIFFSQAQEGMWLLNQIDQLDLNKKGLQLKTSELYSPDQPALYQAIIQLGGGTASFVSPNGLILTNHHVAFGALQRASSVNSDYLNNGFLARERKDEISAPGYQALSLLEMKDVTPEIMKAIKGMKDPSERDKKINEVSVKMTDEAEKGKDDVMASIAEMYNGKQYILFVYKVFKDIRIVYAPPRSIGEYGGEIDNWEWPRHTGDFSFLRVYVSPDGKGAEYNTENIPYKPAVWLKVAKEALKDGDFTFVIGFPGATTRYRTSNSVAWNLNYNYPFSIKNFNELIAMMQDLTKNDPEGQLKVASNIKGLANASKNYQGKVDGMIRTNFLQEKKDFEKDFSKWINSNPEAKAKYGTLLDDIQAQYKIIDKTRERDDVLGLMQGLAGVELSLALRLNQIAIEMEKPKKERQPGFDETSIERTKQALPNFYSSYYEPVDEAMFARTLKMAEELPAGQRIEAVDLVLAKSGMGADKYAGMAYKNSKLNDMEYTASLFGKSSKELADLNDPFINLAIALQPVLDENNKVFQSFAANVTDLRKKYIDALYEWKGEGLYPDANGTMRFTYGWVKGYSPEDAVWYYPFTSLKGMVAKNTGKEPFNAPQGMIDLEKSKDFGRFADPKLKDVPVAFLSLGDITGGNSGSPIMNAKGELLGVVFDGNYEAMISDWQYDAELQRIISCDIRYILYVTEKFGKAGFILDEMGVKE